MWMLAKAKEMKVSGEEFQKTYKKQGKKRKTR
jgi:hypothetical protein